MRPQRGKIDSKYCRLSFLAIPLIGYPIRTWDQCDQIWRNFTALAKYYKSWAIFWRFKSICQNCDFGKICFVNLAKKVWSIFLIFWNVRGIYFFFEMIESVNARAELFSTSKNLFGASPLLSNTSKTRRLNNAYRHFRQFHSKESRKAKAAGSCYKPPGCG